MMLVMGGKDLLHGKTITDLDKMLNCRDSKSIVNIVKIVIFAVITYSCESWIVSKIV